MYWEPGTQYRILYRSESLETSVRTIDVIRTNRCGDGLTYIQAFCHLRGSERTFRTDRIIQVERMESSCQAPAQTSPYRPSVQPAFAADKASIVAPPEVEPVGSGGKTAAFVVGLLIGVAMLLSYYENLPGSGSSPPWTGTSSLGSTLSAKPASKPSPPPKPALEVTTIAGYTLRTVRNAGLEHFEVPELGLITRNKLEAVSAIRLPIFVQSEGFFDARLVSRYLDADLNGSGRLSFEELEAFQKKTLREFRYQSNDLALRPDEFLAKGGGDCEDFALYTAGLLRFWGWEPYIASLAQSASSVGHAICLSYEEGAIPKNFEYYTIESWTTEDGSALRPGRYVPIDYDHVGSLSGAVGSGWKLRSVYIPEEAWGLSM